MIMIGVLYIVNNYLIPANTKKGQLILGLFRKIDIIIFGIGIFITVVLLASMTFTSTWTTILVIMPAAICGFLVVPVPHYHNMLVILTELYDFMTTNQKYEWKGWCYKDGKKSRK